MKELEQKLGYSFRDRSLLENALRHSSFANESRDRSVTSNERLEFLGDSVLGFVAAKHLYKDFPNLPEGRMTKVRAELVCENALHKVAMELELGKHIRLGRGEENTGGRTRPSILADAVEATIAAMFLDGGIEVAEAFILSRVLSDLDKGLPVRSTDNKTALQELIQQKNGQVLEYVVTGESGPDHCKQFTVTVYLNGEAVGSGIGRTKKEAEQAAAGDALGKRK
jgi:ribonuclease-3